ncbi:MAG: hypothetical protein AAF151_25165 [Cyanobacteria bacterium J06656_5]
MKTLPSDVQYVAPLDWAITAPHCHIDTAEPFHAIAPNADHEADQYFITLQKLATYQSSPTLPNWMTLELTLELRRLPSPAKPRIEDWVSNNLPGWHIVDWSMPEPDDEFETWPGRHVAIADSSSINELAQASGPSSVAIAGLAGPSSIDAIAQASGLSSIDAIADSCPVDAIAQASGPSSVAIAASSSINAIAL